MTKPKTPADVAALKEIVQEQALKIAALEKEKASLTEQKTNLENARMTYLKETQELKGTLDKIHDLIDACPGAMPRMTTRKSNWGTSEEKEQDVIVRMASWIGAVGRRCD